MFPTRRENYRVIRTDLIDWSILSVNASFRFKRPIKSNLNGTRHFMEYNLKNTAANNAHSYLYKRCSDVGGSEFKTDRY